jgi:peptidoglycan L-alanyl-D-glutamate endopeptidase CwlK
MKFSERSRKNLAGIHPDLVNVMERAIVESPVDFTITEGLRTSERQQELYAQGRTKPGKIVTYADGIVNKSNHQAHEDGYGYAVDLYPYVDGQVRVNDIDSLGKIACHIKSVAGSIEINVEWGGDWKMRDYAHFELKKIT